MTTKLRQFIERLLSSDDASTLETIGGTKIQVKHGRRPSFLFVLMSEHSWWFTLIMGLFTLSFFLAVYGYSNAFARLGGATVLVAVLFGTHCVERINENAAVQIDAQLLEVSAQIADYVAYKRQSDRRLAPGSVPFEISAEFLRASQKIRDAAAHQKRPYRRLEIALASIGTVQWAFGDSIVSFLVVDGGSF